MTQEFDSIFHEETFVHEGKCKKDPSGAKVSTNSSGGKDVSGSKKQVDSYQRRQELKHRTSNIVANDRAGRSSNGESNSPYHTTTSDRGYGHTTFSGEWRGRKYKDSPMPGVKEFAFLDADMI